MSDIMLSGMIRVHVKKGKTKKLIFNNVSICFFPCTFFIAAVKIKKCVVGVVKLLLMFT